MGNYDAFDVNREELVNERTLFAKTFQNSDDSRTYQIEVGPIHFRAHDNPDAWLEIETGLEVSNGWTNRTKNVPVHLPPVLGNGSADLFGKTLSIAWVPGPLKAELWNGEVVELAHPLAS